MLVDAEDEPVAEVGLDLGQPPTADVAEAGVVRAALAVVVVRDDRAPPAQDPAHQPDPRLPAGVLADLVDLVDGQRPVPEGDHGRGREHQGSPTGPGATHAGEGLGHARALPAAACVARGSRPGEDPVGGPDVGQRALDGQGVGRGGQRDRTQRMPQRLGEVLVDLLDQLVGVLLEGERAVHEPGIGRVRQAGEHLPMDAEHPGGRLSRAHDHQSSRHPGSLARGDRTRLRDARHQVWEPLSRVSPSMVTKAQLNPRSASRRSSTP